MLMFEHVGDSVVSLPITSDLLTTVESKIEVLQFDYKLNPQGWNNRKVITYKLSKKGYEQITKSGSFQASELRDMNTVYDDFIKKNINKIYPFINKI